MRKSSKLLAAAVAVFALSSGMTLLAADPDNANRDRNAPAADANRDREGSTMNIDRHIADRLLGMSQAEVQLGNFALKHAQNPEVKKFAEMMVQAHTEFNNKLARFADANVNENRGNQTSANATENRSNETKAADNTRAVDNRAAAGANENRNEHGDHMAQIGKEVGDQIDEAIQKELGQYQGNEFDRAYVGQQFWGHVVFIATAKGLENHINSNELKQVVQDGEKTANQHLEETRKIIRDLSANVARAGTQETQPRR